VPFLESLQVNHLHDITAARVQSYINRKIRQDEIANKTANHILTAIKAFLNYCVKHDYLGRNPAVAIERLKVPKFPGRHLSLDEIHRLLQASKQDQDGRFHPMIATAIYAGMRLGELFALEWEDIDFKRKVVMIKDKPELGLRTKTGRYRTVPMQTKLARLLAPYRKPSGFCFFPEKELRRTTTDFNRHFKQVLKAAKMPKGTNWLTLRRTFGSQLAQSGVDFLRIQTWMGHADPRLTLEHYAHLKPGYDEEINRFPA
jgi:integrase